MSVRPILSNPAHTFASIDAGLISEITSDVCFFFQSELLLQQIKHWNKKHDLYSSCLPPFRTIRFHFRRFIQVYQNPAASGVVRNGHMQTSSPARMPASYKASSAV